ncbi:MAG TPA: DUF2148 domain-containing protein [Bacteroidales bacterium]|nr:DUF2148 domain-containing protein [Bacteroidales bacterium]
MIINEKEIKIAQVLEIGKQMMIAARTAPKGKGVDNLEAILISGDDLQILADAMESSVEKHGRMFFLRDAANIRVAQAVVVLGTRLCTMNLNCGYCGYPTCNAKIKAGDQFPCAFPINDLGIAIGSACATAADLRVDTRVMFSAGTTAMELGWLGTEVKAAFAIPISATSKNPFFDRVSTRPAEKE